MTLTINTNLASMIAERNLNNATNSLNKSLERLSTGYKINHAADNAAGYSISNKWTTQISSLDIAAANASTGADLLTTAEENYKLLTNHLQRIRDLTVQAGNGTYGSTSLKAIQEEVFARLQEISRIASNAEFDGVKLMTYMEDGSIKGTGITSEGINLQVGLYSDENSIINLGSELFHNATVSGLFAGMKIDNVELKTLLGKTVQGELPKYNTDDGYKTLSAAFAGLKITSDGSFVKQEDADASANHFIGFIDKAINNISSIVTKLGAAQNRIESALSAIDVQSQNLTSSLSTMKDTDVANESSKYIQSQILQQASATLLSTANQTPSIALNLI